MDEEVDPGRDAAQLEVLPVEVGGVEVGVADRRPLLDGEDARISLGAVAVEMAAGEDRNPDQRLEEIDYTNNNSSLRIRLTWHAGRPDVETLRTCHSSADC